MKKNILSLSLVLILCSCSNKLDGTWATIIANTDNIHSTSTNSVSPFNTVMQLNYFLNDDNGSQNDKILQDVTKLYNDEISRLHCYFDRHYNYLNNDDSIITNLKVINDSFGKNIPIKCSKELYSLLKLSMECYDLTKGYFNIFTGNITNYWDEIFYEIYNYGDLNDFDPFFNNQKKEELELLVDSIPNNKEEFLQQLTFNDEDMSVIFNSCDFNNNQKIIISVGGIGKGYATDLVKQKLIENSFYDGYLISGGSSLSTVSKPIFTKKQKGQSVSVINPELTSFKEKVVAFKMKFTEEFNFSTSGNYTSGKSYSFLAGNDRIYRHHIINPFTGYPESFYRSVSIKTSSFSNAFVDAFSTAFMCLPIEEGLNLRNELLDIYQGYDLEVFYLLQDGIKENATFKVIATSSMNDTLQVEDGVELIYES